MTNGPGGVQGSEVDGEVFSSAPQITNGNYRFSARLRPVSHPRRSLSLRSLTQAFRPELTSAAPTALIGEPEIQARRTFSPAPVRLLAALAFAAVLAFAPHPAFAQHGGGGGGHAGGGFGGGGHAGGGFGGGHASGGSRGGGAAPIGRGTYGGGSSSGNASGYSSGTSGGANSAAHSAAPSRFIGASTWQAPPSNAMRGGAQPSSHFITADEAAASGARVAARPVEPRGIANPLGASTALRGGSFASSNAIRTRPYAAQFVGAPPHVPPFPRRNFFFGPGFGGCFGPFFFGCGGGFFGGGFGFGLGYGYGYYCDPFWGCPGYNSGYYNGGYYGNEIYNQSTDESSVSNEFNPSRYWGPSAPPEDTGGGAASSSDSEVVLFLKDGTVYAITDYWIADNKLHYVTNYGGENSIPLEQIDMQRTVDVNAKRGVNITLRPTPQSQQAAPPPDAPQLPDAAPSPEAAPAPPPAPSAAPPPPAPAPPQPQPDTSSPY